MLQTSHARLRLVVIVTTVVAAGGAATLPAIATGVIYREWADTGALAAALAVAYWMVSAMCLPASASST